MHRRGRPKEITKQAKPVKENLVFCLANSTVKSQPGDVPGRPWVMNKRGRRGYVARTEDQQMVNCRPDDLLHAYCLEMLEPADIPCSQAMWRSIAPSRVDSRSESSDPRVQSGAWLNVRGLGSSSRWLRGWWLVLRRDIFIFPSYWSRLATFLNHLIRTPVVLLGQLSILFLQRPSCGFQTINHAANISTRSRFGETGSIIISADPVH
jgi:hypothetical protein